MAGLPTSRHDAPRGLRRVGLWLIATARALGMVQPPVLDDWRACPHCGKPTNHGYRRCSACGRMLVPQSKWDRGMERRRSPRD